MKTAFIGHRNVFSKGISHLLEGVIKEQIEKGCNSFIVGTYGAFDKLALDACRRLHKTYPDIQIEVAVPSSDTIEKDFVYDDVKTVTLDIKNYKNNLRQTMINRRIIDSCDTLICYMDPNSNESSATKIAVIYALKHGVHVINVHRAVDRLFTGLFKNESEEYRKEIAEFLNNTTKKLSEF